MQRATLYILIGYPGSGKTTASRYIEELTGAEHIWTDHERRKRFGHPTHSQTESDELYHRLNHHMEQLLQAGKNVVFDTSFNFRKDREYMRKIAAKHDAAVVIVQMNTPKELSKTRALHLDHARDNNYAVAMSPELFERIASHLEQPTADEYPVTLPGVGLTRKIVAEKLRLAHEPAA